MKQLDKAIDDYYTWLRKKTVISKDEQTGWTAITTPFTGLFNDNIEIYAKQENNKLILSDDGWALNNLELTGVSVATSEKAKEWFGMICLNYGISVKKKELQIVGPAEDFTQNKHGLIAAIREVSDMAIIAKPRAPRAPSFFKEDVKAFLDGQGIAYSPQFMAKGTTGIDFTFDFKIAGKNEELVIRSFNSLDKNNVPGFLFAWNDIKEARQNASGKSLKSLAIVNNEDKEVKEEYIKALENKGSGIIKWTEREKEKERDKLKLIA